jgi:hypothetical protein
VAQLTSPSSMQSSMLCCKVSDLIMMWSRCPLASLLIFIIVKFNFAKKLNFTKQGLLRCTGNHCLELLHTNVGRGYSEKSSFG